MIASSKSKAGKEITSFHDLAKLAKVSEKAIICIGEKYFVINASELVFMTVSEISKYKVYEYRTGGFAG